MSQIKEVFTDTKNKESYASDSRYIVKRSVSDRRKKNNDRRVPSDRRKPFARSPQISKSTVNKQRKREISLNIVRVLEEEYRKILSLMNQLILSTEFTNYSRLPAHILKFDRKVKSNLAMEEEMLYLFVDSLSNKSFKEKADIHHLLDNFIYNASQKIIELIEPYLTAGVTDDNVKKFLAEVNTIDKILAKNHMQKENYLYKIYVRCYV